jgi:hypothetical protein
MRQLVRIVGVVVILAVVPGQAPGQEAGGSVGQRFLHRSDPSRSHGRRSPQQPGRRLAEEEVPGYKCLADFTTANSNVRIIM